jgi:hypothetical protein
MGRKKSWTAKNQKDWALLRATPTFQALEFLAGEGLLKVDPGDIRELVEESPELTSHSNLATFRAEMMAAIERIEPEARREAVAALLRATPESEALKVAQAQALARVHLGEADNWRGQIAKRSGKVESDVTPLELLEGIRTGNENFRRPPKPSRRPGERFRLLRDLYDQLSPGRDAGHAIVDQQPRGAAVSVEGRRDSEDVRQILKRQYDTELELERFAALVIDDHRAIEHLSLDVVLSNCCDELFLFSVNREFHARFDRYVVGIAAGSESHRASMRLVPELRELIWLPEGTDLKRETTALVEDGMLMIRDTATTTGYRPALFDDVAADDPLAERVAGAGLREGEYRLIEARIENPDSLLHYRSSLGMRLKRERRRCTWFADGPTYVDKIRIDVSGMDDATRSSNLAVADFLPGTEIACGPQRFEREVHAWVVRHHGFTISW